MLNTYQRRAAETAVYPDLGQGVYPALGLGGEAGEVLEKVKKYHRDHPCPENAFCGLGLAPSWAELEAWETDTREELKKELGDVLWYVSEVARAFDLTLGEIAEANLAKLAARQAAGTLKGSGDDR